MHRISLDPNLIVIVSSGTNGGGFEADSSSISIYESPMSSIYETPVSSPLYATPMEGTSPWASPRTSIRSDNSRSNSLLEPPNNTNISPNLPLPKQNNNSSIDGSTTGDSTKLNPLPSVPIRGSTVQNNKPFTG